MLADIMIWVLIIGIILLVISGIFWVVSIMRMDIPILTTILFFGVAITSGLAGLFAIGAFIVIIGIPFFLDIAVAGNVALSVSAVAIVAGGLLGLGIAFNYGKGRKDACLADPSCSLK